LVSATGRILGAYHKCFLWDFDHDWFEPGQTVEPLDSDIGRIGIMICADARLPEIPATLVQRGASLIVHPTAWVNVGSANALWNPQPDFLVPARAKEFGIAIASASKWGVEGDTTFVGSSLICDGAGNVLAQCGTRETTVVSAEVGLTRPRASRVRAADRAVLLGPQPPMLRVVIHPPPGPAVRCKTPRMRHSRSVGPPSPTFRRDEGGRAGLGGPALQFCRGPLERAPAAGVGEQHPSPTLVIQPGLPTARRAGPSPRAGARTATLAGPRRGAFLLQGICIAAVSDEDARGFAPIRTLALRGTHVVVVFGEKADPVILRARAAENCVFIVAAVSAGAAVYDPGGKVLASCSWSPTTDNNRTDAPLAATLDTAQAANKLVAPRTDTLAGRNPSQYAF